MVKAVAAIVGSAFPNVASALGLELKPVAIDTTNVSDIYRVAGLGTEHARPAYLVHRHGHSHRLLPHQIDYREVVRRLTSLDVGALLVTSSVGVLAPDVPLGELCAVGDILTLDNRLPNGRVCTMFPNHRSDPNHAHLVLTDGLLSTALTAQLDDMVGHELRRVVFGYVAGPRTKTPAENRMWASLGAQVNSMSLAPEVILANEMGIPCAGAVIGHKVSSGSEELTTARQVGESLEAGRHALETLVVRFLREAEPVEFANLIYRFGDP